MRGAGGGAGLLIVGALAAGSSGSAALGFAALLVFALGLPHGAGDLLLVEERGRPAFVIAYLLAAAAVLAVWQVAPGIALAGFLLLSAAHFAADARAGEGAAVAGLIVGGPALLHGGEVAALFRAAGAGGVAGPLSMLLAGAGLAGAVAALVHATRWPDRRMALAAGAFAAIVPGPLPGFAAAFVLLHAWPEARVRAAEAGIALPRYLRRVSPMMAGAAGVCAVAALAVRGRPDLGSAALFAGLSALATPHMLVTPFWTRPGQAALA